MSVPFVTEFAVRAVEILTDDRYAREPRLASDVLYAAFPEEHWSMLDENLDCASHLVRSAAGLAASVGAGSLNFDDALMSLRMKYDWFPEDSCRRALEFAIRASDAGRAI